MIYIISCCEFLTSYFYWRIRGIRGCPLLPQHFLQVVGGRSCYGRTDLSSSSDLNFSASSRVIHRLIHAVNDARQYTLEAIYGSATLSSQLYHPSNVIPWPRLLARKAARHQAELLHGTRCPAPMQPCIAIIWIYSCVVAHSVPCVELLDISHPARLLGSSRSRGPAIAVIRLEGVTYALMRRGEEVSP